MAAIDAYGQAVNLYPATARLSGAAPGSPWAVHLADAAGAFHLVVFDLDAHGDTCPGGARQAGAEAAALGELLSGVGIEHVVCASGPGGGRHVWIAMADPIGAQDACALAHLARSVFPSVDVSPMLNPATGSVRPPGSPHRDGGASVVIAGDLTALTAPSTTAAQIAALTAALSARAPTPTSGPDLAGGLSGLQVLIDDEGHPHLAGSRRALPAGAAVALAAVPVDDCSGPLWSVLLGAAAARWRYADVASLVATYPGMEHARTQRAGQARQIRPARGPSSSGAVLAHQWRRAVAHVATSQRQVGTDPTFDARAGYVAVAVRDCQAEADAAAGTWTSRTGPVQRRVLDGLCLIALRAVRIDVEAANRTLAELLGVGRESVRTALLALAEQGWIAPHAQAVGVRASSWKIRPPAVIHNYHDQQRSQADSRPSPTPHPTYEIAEPPAIAGLGAAAREVALAALEAKVAAFAHDVFTPGALGFAAGNAYATLPEASDTPAISGARRHIASMPSLVRLAAAGLLYAGPIDYVRAPADRRDAVAVERGVAGVLAERALAYAAERTAWLWWQAEAVWMSAPRRTSGTRRPGVGQLALSRDAPSAWAAHPRTREGRADYKAARAHIAAGQHVFTPQPTRTPTTRRIVLPPDPSPAGPHTTPPWVRARRREFADA